MIPEKPNVLYVDDEVNNLVAFDASFRRHFNVFTCAKPSDVKRILKENDIHILITDERMPEMTGIELLESILEDFPSVIKILMTGYLDIEPIIQAINKIGVFRYIQRPWVEHEIKMTIDSAFEMYCAKFLLREKTLKLQKAYEELDKFAYSASHDLRAPLASILGLINIAKLENKDSEYLQLIEKSALRLDAYTRDILNYYKNGKMSVLIKEIDFESLANEVIDHVNFFQPTENIHFKIDVEQEESFYSDEIRVRILLNNLISNAIKYQDKTKKQHTVNLGIKIKHGLANIFIKDNGIGIKEAHLDNIFNIFYRGTDSGHGSGLGLFIVKEIVTKLKGDIAVKSKANEGTEINISMPCKQYFLEEN